MNYLAIDTSGKNLTVIISKDGKTDIYFDAECGVQHSVKVMPAVEIALETAKTEIKDLDFLACVVGAGSFTGIRIGVSTVKALCFASKKPCLSITSFDTVAYNKVSGKQLAVIDAKHGSFYVAGYTDGKISYPPAFIDRAELDRLSEEYSLLSGEVIKGLETTVVSVAEGLEKAVNAKCGEVTLDLDGLTPLYIRKSQAEEGR